jgi:hypothetical protein
MTLSNPQPQDSTKPKNSVFYLTPDGLKLGFKLGLFLPVAYLVIAILVIELLQLNFHTTTIAHLREFRPEPRMFFVLFVHILPGLLFQYAIVPSVFYGVFTGALLGIIIGSLKKRFSRYAILILSVTVCIIIAFSSYIFFGIHPVLSFENESFYSFGIYETFPITIGFPTVIYIFASGWLGWQLYSKMLKQTEKSGES